MKIVGIISEYNPFHPGHAFHLKKSRQITGADYVIAAMSGNYVQRGVPAMFDKYLRAEAALRNGADLVLELPPCVSTGSAEYFSSGAVALLEASGVVTDLCFGSECGDLALLERPAEILLEEPESYRNLLRQRLKAGNPYPKARALALHQYDPSIPEEILSRPNNLLGLEYLKALKRSGSSIRPHTISRIGAGYHGQGIDGPEPASASGIRLAFQQSGGVFTEALKSQLPSWEVYQSCSGKPPVTEDAFSLLLLEKLRRIQGEDLTRYFDVPEELSNRIWNCLDEFSSFSQFTDLLKTRNLTRTAISRALLHILLDIRKYESPKCFRVLGFRKSASGLLRLLSEKGSLPLVTAPSGETLPGGWVYADRLYESVCSLLHSRPYRNEYQRKMLVL